MNRLKVEKWQSVVDAAAVSEMGTHKTTLEIGQWKICRTWFTLAPDDQKLNISKTHFCNKVSSREITVNLANSIK